MEAVFLLLTFVLPSHKDGGTCNILLPLELNTEKPSFFILYVDTVWLLNGFSLKDKSFPKDTCSCSQFATGPGSWPPGNNILPRGHQLVMQFLSLLGICSIACHFWNEWLTIKYVIYGWNGSFRAILSMMPICPERACWQSCLYGHPLWDCKIPLALCLWGLRYRFWKVFFQKTWTSYFQLSI